MLRPSLFRNEEVKHQAIPIDLKGTNGGIVALGEATIERRYFPATMMAGRLWLDGPDFAYCTERQVDMILTVEARKVETQEDMDRAIRSVGFPSVRVWIAEGLENAAMLEWTRTRGSNGPK